MLESDIQCIDEENGKLVFIVGKSLVSECGSPNLILPALFNDEIPVGSYLMLRVVKGSLIKIATFICLNASQNSKLPAEFVMNNLFWFEITDLGFNWIRAK